MKRTTKTKPGWQAELEARIYSKIQELRRQQVAGMGIDNLRAVVNPGNLPPYTGANAAFIYKQDFAAICKASPRISKFLI